MSAILHDLRFAGRTLLRSPGFTFVAILTLALGIGAATALYSVVEAVLLRPLPYPDSARIIQLFQLSEKGGRMNLSDPNFEDLKEQSRSFEALAEVTGASTESVTGGSEPVRAAEVDVGKEFFAAIGVLPNVGRGFLPEEQKEGGAPAVIVSHGFWQRVLGASPELASKTLRFQDRVYQVVGVMPPGFAFPAGVDLWVPRELSHRYPSRTAHNFQVYGRLREGVSLGAAQKEVSTIAVRLKQQYGDDTWMADAAVVPLHEQLVGKVRPALIVLLGAAAFLLLVACANVANLLLARMATRQRELAVRMALGAQRGRLATQLVTETFVLAIAGGVGGVLLAFWGVGALLAFEPGNLPRRSEIGVSASVLLFTLGVSVVTAVVLGLLAAWRGTDRDLRGALAQGSRTMAGAASSRRVRAGLVVAQVAMTFVLLVGAGLLARSFLRLLAIDPGFRTDGAVVMDISLPSPEDEAAGRRQIQLHDELLSRLRSIPGVETVGGVNDFPMGGNYPNGTFLILDPGDKLTGFEDFEKLAKNPERTGSANYRVASPDYFHAMGIRTVRGRAFVESDGPDAAPVAVISDSLARTRWPNEEPLGKLIEFGNMDGDLRPMQIVGVVSDIHEASLDADPQPTLYGCSRQRPNAASRFQFVLQGQAGLEAVMPAARATLGDLLPGVAPRFRTLEEVFATSLSDRRFSLLLLGAFGATALFLAILGIYGVVSYVVAQRTSEIGVRMAFGAQRSDVLWMVIRHGATLALVGIALGVATGLGLTRLMESLLYGVGATDLTAFGGVALLLALVAVLASAIPAVRASRVDPMIALRGE